MKRLVHATLAAAACGIALLVSSAGVAHAAVGDFTYTLVGSDLQTITDPAGDVCIPLGSPPHPVVLAENLTDQVTLLYANEECLGDPLTELASGAAGEFAAEDRIQAIQFVTAR